jgi:hypothetical protein
VEERHYPGGHIGIILSLVPGLRGRTPLYRDMLEFMRSTNLRAEHQHGAAR